jgi:hypothetical protein
MEKYLALLIALNGNETFTISRETDSLDKKTVYDFLKQTACVEDEHMDTILIFKNGSDVPEVVRFWTAGGGDFEAF